jgi:endonuclease/exonuclease/phosphatase family metal-dependent hydrolase
MACGNLLRKIAVAWLLCSVVVIILTGIVVSCAQQQPPAETITLGTFNMEWFGDNSPDDRKQRTESDVALLASIIRDTDADVLAVQEVENEQAMQRLLQSLPEYRFVLGTTGGKQHVGVLYRSSVSVQRVEERWLWMETSGTVSEKAKPNPTRGGLVVLCTADNTCWVMMVVHLKSTSRADSTPALVERSRVIRQAQAVSVRSWTDSVTRRGEYAVVIGDFNDSPLKKRSTLDTLKRPLKSTSKLTFVTEGLRSCAYSALAGIDHIVVSPSLQQRVIAGTLHTVNFRAELPDALAKRVSDHCPVVVQLNVGHRVRVRVRVNVAAP